MQRRQNRGWLSPTVNLAQRLEELNKELDTDCLICGTTFKAAESNCVDAVAMGSVQVRGRESAVEVFALGYKSPRREPPTAAATTMRPDAAIVTFFAACRATGVSSPSALSSPQDK